MQTPKTVQQQEQERSESSAKQLATAAVAASTAAAEERSKTETVENADLGREAYHKADGKAQKDFMRAFIASAAGKLAIKRVKLNPATIHELEVLAHKDLSFALCSFVLLRTKAKAAST